MQSTNSTILIRIRHRDVDPTLLTEAFGIEPEYAWKAGDAKPGSESGATRRESYWVAQVPLSRGFSLEELHGRAVFRLKRKGSPLPAAEISEDAPQVTYSYPDQEPLERALMLATLLFKLNEEFWTRLQSEGATAQLIVVLGEEALAAFELPHHIIAMLSRFGLSLSVSLREVDEAAA